MYGSVFKQLSFTDNLTAKRLRHFGLRRYCTVCQSWTARFFPFGRPRREQAMCPVCGALERHRLLWYFLHNHLNITDTTPRTLLQFAPVPVMRVKFQQMPHLRYITTDLIDPDVDFHTDITQLSLASESVDAILCSHVLEHIPDDSRAMEEMYRILKTGGQLIVMVPFYRTQTLEALDADDAERQRLFDNPYHVRDYGWDIVTRLADCGYDVRAYHPYEIFSPLQVALSHPVKTDFIFLARKA